MNVKGEKRISIIVKKNIFLIIFFLLFYPEAAKIYATKIEMSIKGGFRNYSNSTASDAYGIGITYGAELVFRLGNLSLFTGFESSTGSGKIGLFNDKSNFTTSGFEGGIGFTFKIKKVDPFIKIGLGYYSYKQTFDNPLLLQYNNEGNKLSPFGALGALYKLGKSFLLTLETKYIHMEIIKNNKKIQLGGIRLLVGFGYILKL